MPISLLGYAPFFFWYFSHGTIIIAPSFSFPNVVKSCCFVLFLSRKRQTIKQKSSAFKNLLPHISTMEVL